MANEAEATKRRRGQRGPDHRPRKRHGIAPKHLPPRSPGPSLGVSQAETAAIKSLRWRVPDNVPELAASLASEAFGVIVDVMRGARPSDQRTAVLSAAKAIREEVCGAVKQRHEFPGGTTVYVLTDTPPRADLDG